MVLPNDLAKKRNSFSGIDQNSLLPSHFKKLVIFFELKVSEIYDKNKEQNLQEHHKNRY